MKKILIPVLILCTLVAGAQKTPVKKTTAKPFKNLADSASYGLGISVANFYKQQGIKNLNTALIAKAINDVQSGGKTLLSDDEANEAIMFYMDPGMKARTQPTVAAGKKFLASNKSKPGIKTTASGLQYEVLTQGTGAKPTKASDTVVVHYTGSFIDGTVFESSRTSGNTIEFPLNGVIKGWTEGVQLMSVGSKYKFYIPYNLAYGINGRGTIPGGAVLIFEIELFNVKPAKG